MAEDNGPWIAVLCLLSFAWTLWLGFLFRARGRRVPAFAGTIDLPVSDVYVAARVVVLMFLTAVAITVFLDLGAWALTRFTVWSLFLSIGYFISVIEHRQPAVSRPNVVILCLAAELVVCVVYWSLYEKTFAEQTAREQFHTLGAHALVQVFLLIEFLLARANGGSPDRGRIALALTGFMVAYGTAVYAFSYGTDSTLPYSVIDPDEVPAAAAVVAAVWAVAVGTSAALVSIYKHTFGTSPKTTEATQLGNLIF